MRITVIGNCQSNQVASALRALCPEADVKRLHVLHSGSLPQHADESDFLFVQPPLRKKLAEQLSPKQRNKVLVFPRLAFSAYHPDTVFGPTGRSPLSHSAWAAGSTSGPVLFAWSRKMSVEDTLGLFTEESFRKLGFLRRWDRAKEALLNEGRKSDVALEGIFGSWKKKGPFMWMANHPKGFALADVARSLLEAIGVPCRSPAELDIPDLLQKQGHWAIYPAVARHLGVEEVPFRTAEDGKLGRRTLTLEEFIRESFEIFDKSEIDLAAFPQIATEAYNSLFKKKEKASPRTESRPSNPYSDIPDYQLWRRGVERVAADELDPVAAAPFTLTPSMKVATAGSCFAQHISRRLSRLGFNYFVPEQPPAGVTDNDRLERNYGVFSARYGNIYTTRQLLQLFERAYGRFSPEDSVWLRPDGKLADPFRPQIEPNGFDTADQLFADRERHLSSVRRMFEELDVFVFTLGLTEAWRSRRDGAVFPLAPGVAAGSMDNRAYEFVNLGIRDTTDDLQQALDKLREVNPASKVILTVSPVPLIATYEPQHVLVSTTYSKSVLRVAADEIARCNDNVWYFPSYEIITGSYARGKYFDSDLRSVTPEGVDHVMRVFIKHATQQVPAAEEHQEASDIFEIVCDEEVLDS